MTLIPVFYPFGKAAVPVVEPDDVEAGLHDRLVDVGKPGRALFIHPDDEQDRRVFRVAEGLVVDPNPVGRHLAAAVCLNPHGRPRKTLTETIFL